MRITHLSTGVFIGVAALAAAPAEDRADDRAAILH
jgi:hypothetical protein